LLPPPHLQSLPYCNTIARPLRNIRPPTNPLLHAIHHTISLMAILCNGQLGAGLVVPLYAQLLACELYDMKNNKKRHPFFIPFFRIVVVKDLLPPSPAWLVSAAPATFTKTKKYSPNTGARAHDTLQVTRRPHRVACSAECVRRAPLGTTRHPCASSHNTTPRYLAGGCQRGVFRLGLAVAVLIIINNASMMITIITAPFLAQVLPGIWLGGAGGGVFRF